MAQLVEEAEKGMESVVDEGASGMGSSTHGDNGELPSDKEAAGAAANQSGEWGVVSAQCLVMRVSDMSLP